MIFDWFMLIVASLGLVVAFEFGYRCAEWDAKAANDYDKRYTDSGVMSEWQQRAMQDRAQDTEGL